MLCITLDELSTFFLSYLMSSCGKYKILISLTNGSTPSLGIVACKGKFGLEGVVPGVRFAPYSRNSILEAGFLTNFVRLADCSGFICARKVGETSSFSWKAMRYKILLHFPLLLSSRQVQEEFFQLLRSRIIYHNDGGSFIIRNLS